MLIYALLCPALHAVSQPVERSLLWEVTHPAYTGSSYLYGTLHSRDQRVFRFHDSVWVAYAACDLVAGELEMGETRRLVPTAMDAMFIPGGRSLDQLYGKREYARLALALKERLGPLAPLTMRLQPFYTMALLSELELGNDSAEVLDAWWQSKARREGRDVIGLETMEEQLAAVRRIPLRTQARLLLALATDTAHAGSMDEALSCYSRADLSGLMKLMERDGLPEHADKALLDERNARMAGRLDQRIQQGRRVFVTVGAAHLPGPKGLIADLRARGYRVRAVGVVR